MASNLGPLTTTFTPPSSCLGVHTFFRNANTADVKIPDAPECLPTNFATGGYYSPGLFCPQGYQASTESSGAETSLNCCPSQFQYQGPWPGTCVSVDTTTTFAVYVTQDSPASTITTQQYTRTTGASVWADAIQVRYQASDLLPTLAVSSSSSTATPGSSVSASLPSSSSSSSATSTAGTGSSSGLSTAAKIAIGVVIPVIVLAIALIAFLLYRRKTRNMSGSARRADLDPAGAVEMPAGEVKYLPVEQQIRELPATETKVAAKVSNPSGGAPAELE